MSEGIFNAVIGTAGHIDHGKSTLVKSLTDIDPDRLPEEKEREMTIDIGFANMKLKDGRRIGIIDVPGHEDFIKNMLAGATGVDFVILVVAANEGVMPQTVEHLRIMQLLGIKKGLIALTMCDMTEPDMIELVSEDLRALVKDTFLEGAPIMQVSNKTKAGIRELYEAVDQGIRDLPPRDDDFVFRMYIQRVFSKKGFGAVVTGVPVSGSAKINDEVEVVQHDKRYKIKSLHAYMSEVDSISAGHSSAMNLANCDYKEVSRGFVVAAPGHYKTSLEFQVEFNFARDAERFLPERMKKLRSGFPVKFYVGTAEADGKIIFLETNALSPGEKATANIKLIDPIVVQEADKFILRTQTPTYTVGGGIVINVPAARLRMKKAEFVGFLRDKNDSLGDTTRRVDFLLRNHTGEFLSLMRLSLVTHITQDSLSAIIDKLKGNLIFYSDSRFCHREAIEASKKLVISAIESFHKENTSKAGVTDVVLRRMTRFDDRFFEMIVAEMKKECSIEAVGDVYRLPGAKIKLSKDESAIYEQLEGMIRSRALATPKFDELPALFPNVPTRKVESVLKILTDEGKVIYMKDGVLLHSETLESVKTKLREALTKEKSMEPSRIRDLLNTSRKYIIPLLEYLDSIKFTKRVGNKRVLNV